MEVDPPHLRAFGGGKNPSVHRPTAANDMSDPADGGWFHDHEGGRALEDVILWSSQRGCQLAGAPRRVHFDLWSCLGSVHRMRAQFKESSIRRALSHRSFGGMLILRTEKGYIDVLNPRPPSWNRSLTCVCMCVRADTDLELHWCNEFSWAWSMLGTLVRSSTSCASLSAELLRARASVARDGPWRETVRCLR